jgi:hypothetical protein
VSGVRVCQARDATPLYHNVKLKGLMVFGSVVASGGNVIPLGIPAVFTRTSCGGGPDWAPAVMCPTGQIVTAVTMYHFAENKTPPRAFFAMAPDCKGLKVRTAAGQPARDSKGY